MAQAPVRRIYGPERMLAFSDGVIAVAMTLLVLDIRLPPMSGSVSDSQLADALVGILPKLGMYALSFVVVGSIWLAHHQKFSYIERVDRRLMQLNLLFLMSVGLVPFVTSLVSEYSNKVATMVYAASMMTTLLLLAATGWYAARHADLIAKTAPRDIGRELILVPLLSAAVFAASIAVALLDSTAGRLMWVLTFPVTLFAVLKLPRMTDT
ncbi:DUF1211 domain-containing protein [Bradyrhizobium sediminis]|uniref:DUF1211 domain-containing protein n=1 Tax=Bradyrhizobium sediminis TaxID=2840469 RepID=A0A975NC09_9BRAD|nr:TMEM175 family protein [Bradyrhizobium sediminis]QWG12318.1 DUF1211 domain-containing protein [Bradyrhizobium sediminis]